MSLEDLTLNEVVCCECSKPISSIPAWMADAKVKFECEDCRQKRPRIAGMPDIDHARHNAHDEEELHQLGAVLEVAVDEDVDDEMGDGPDPAEE